MKQHLILRLEAPLMAFGGETIDNLGVIRRFPAASMLTGLLANALGWRRVESQKHQELQDRLVFAARIDREPAGGGRLTDYQTVKMGDSVDLFVRSGHWVVGWTTRGTPDERAGQLGSVGSGPFTHQRWRDYHNDMRVTVALRLEPANLSPTLEELAVALRQPARPLFIGRKPCLPSAPLLASEWGPWAEGDTALTVLRNCALSDEDVEFHQSRQGGRTTDVALLWPDGEGDGETPPSRTYMITDERNWATSGLHGGGRLIHEASLARDRFGLADRMEAGKEAYE